VIRGRAVRAADTAMPAEFQIDKLSDEFGQYTLVLKIPRERSKTFSVTVWSGTVSRTSQATPLKKTCGRTLKTRTLYCKVTRVRAIVP
jgi:hypothetical protein